MTSRFTFTTWRFCIISPDQRYFQGK